MALVIQEQLRTPQSDSCLYFSCVQHVFVFKKKKKLKRKRNTHHSVTFSSEEDKKIHAIMQQGGDAELVAVSRVFKTIIA